MSDNSVSTETIGVAMRTFTDRTTTPRMSAKASIASSDLSAI